jgi:hypothetical protein
VARQSTKDQGRPRFLFKSSDFLVISRVSRWPVDFLLSWHQEFGVALYPVDFDQPDFYYRTVRLATKNPARGFCLRGSQKSGVVVVWCVVVVCWVEPSGTTKTSILA